MGGRARWADGFIAVDWGTTNRRAYLMDSAGACTAEFEDGKGILSVPAGGFPDAIADIRGRLGDHPLLLAGMIGSNRGWIEAPYVPCPASLDDIVEGIVWASERRDAIVPGVSFVGDGRADVMRGEEVQLLGAVASGMIPANGLVCHPGTHNKWASVVGGKISSFRTVMTGELFSLLKDHSILSDLLQRDVEPDEAFRSGVRRALDHDAQAELFGVRARVLLNQSPRDEAASYASGLLIGSDVRIGLAGNPAGRVVIMGRPELTELYAAALGEAGASFTEVDGERCFLAGASAIAERLNDVRAS